MNHNLDTLAKGMFLQSIREDRAGELLECLFEGGSATLDAATGKLVMLPGSAFQSLFDSTDDCEHQPLPHDPYKGDAECANCGARLISDGPDHEGRQTWTTADQS